VQLKEQDEQFNPYQQGHRPDREIELPGNGDVPEPPKQDESTFHQCAPE
jgi:hypothetical protein